MIIFAAAAAMAMLASEPKPGEYDYRTVGRVQKVEEVETESATFVDYERHQWPGLYWEAGFKGRKLSIGFDWGENNRYRVVVDGQVKTIIDKPYGPTTIEGLKGGTHTVRLEKLNESQDKVFKFWGFSTPGGKVWPTPARARQIEFIGDSGVVGYGNLSETRDCTDEEHRVRTDVHQAWGPLTARHFDADYEVNAFSGFGVVRAYGGLYPKAPPLPELYKYALFEEPRPPVDDPLWRPQIIVIELGGNDFSAPVKPGEKWADDDALKADFEGSYVAFVKRLHGQNPDAFILLAEVQGPIVRDEVEKVAAQLKASGDTKIDTFQVDNFELKGCDWHFDAADHRRISQTLVDYIDAHPGLWQGK